jgi:hypothetical protein
MTTPVMRYASVAFGSKKVHLVFKRVTAKGPAVAKNDWLSSAPVFIEKFHSVHVNFCHKNSFIIG